MLKLPILRGAAANAFRVTWSERIEQEGQGKLRTGARVRLDLANDGTVSIWNLEFNKLGNKFCKNHLDKQQRAKA